MTRLVNRLRARLTYANVTATLALFVALGGTGYAAITLPRDSVGSKQVRSNAIRSGDIRNSTIQTRDISKRARAALRGAQGPAGPVGPAGPGAITERALVSSNGRQVSGTAVATAWSATQPELHQLTFGRDVSTCAMSATLAAVPGGNVTEPSAGRITVASGGGRVVNVKTYDAAGNPAEQPFHLVLAC
jgi:hypothetical protein